jgi:hypothetical protein
LKHLKPMLVLLTVCSFAVTARSQDNPDLVDKITNFPSTFFSKVNKKTASLEERLTQQTQKYLQRLAKREKKLKRKLSKIDSTEAQRLFGNSEEQYAKMTSMMSQVSSPTGGGRVGGEYIPAMDSLKTSLSFLQQNNQLLSNSKDIQQKVQGSLANVNQLQSKLQQTEQVKAFIQQRKEQIKQSFSKYTNLPKGVTNSIGDFNKQAYYYSAQIKEYRDLLKDPDKMVEKGLSLLNKVPAFKQFMQQHSELASLFRLPDNYGTPQSLAGLQTRAMVQQQIQTQLSSAGPNAQQYLQQNLQAAQSQLNQLKDKVLNSPSSGGGRGEADMPDFKPNNQKTKSFWQRLEYGTNFQTARSNYFFPTTTDLGLSVGYKISDKSTIGVGASYKMGWGQDIRHIAITHQGAGLRSYLDIKLKGSFYASGGYEYNYQPPSIGDSSSPSTGGGWGQAATNWQQSGLIGLSKIISVKSKFFKKTRLQLFWDFLSYQQTPRTQPVKFRVGYNF